MKEQTTKKLHPYKLLVVLLWGSLSGKTVIRPGRIKQRTSPLALRLGVDNSKVRVYVKELQRIGLIRDVILGRGYFYATITEPTLWEGVKD